MKNQKIKVFYTPKQVNTNSNIIGATSRSPLKPMLLMKALDGLGFEKYLEVENDFKPFSDEDFKIAHHAGYVDAFFNGTSNGQYSCHSNGLPWSKELAESVRYTNASLYNAIKSSYLNPEQVCFSPTSGFHHARPSSGVGFCTFSGQVIAAVKMYEEFGVSGAFLDLDGHYGNSIEDSRREVKNLNYAIPVGFNFAQLNGKNKSYHDSLVIALDKIEQAVLNNMIHYVVWCHGADSHDQDDLGGQVNTEYWVKCSETFYTWVKQLDEKLASLGRKPLPVSLSLFGGYRRDSYAAVLSLHIKDISVCLNTLCGAQSRFSAKLASQKGYNTEKWMNVGGNAMPLSLLKMLHPKKYMDDTEFKKTKMCPNEVKVLEFLKSHPCVLYTGIQLGKEVNGWQNHSMGKWAKNLIRRELITGGIHGYSFVIGRPILANIHQFQK